MSTITEPIYQDGKWYEYGGYDAAGRVVRTEVDPPTVEMSAITEPAKRGLFYREPGHGQWYESIWFWFFVAITAVFAIWWINMSYTQGALYDSPSPYATGPQTPFDPDGMDYLIGLFGWVWWAWIPLGIGIVGALQKAGYKRFAAVFSIALTAAIVAFFARSGRTSPNP